MNIYNYVPNYEINCDFIVLAKLIILYNMNYFLQYRIGINIDIQLDSEMLFRSVESVSIIMNRYLYLYWIYL